MGFNVYCQFTLILQIFQKSLKNEHNFILFLDFAMVNTTVYSMMMLTDLKVGMRFG